MDDLGPWLSATLEHLKQKWQAHLPAVGIVFGGMMAVLFIAMFAMFVLMFMGGFIGAFLADQTGEDVVGLLFSVGGMLLGYGILMGGMLLIQPLMMGYLRFVLLLVRKEEPKLGELMWSLKRLPRVIALMVIQMTLSFVAAMFCYLPVFIVMGALFFAWPLMIDRDLGAIASIKASWDMARSRLMELTLLVFLLFMMSMVMAYVPLVGPVIMFAVWITLQVVAYEDLRQRDAA